MRLLLVLLLALAAPRAALAQRTLVIESFSADVRVLENGHIEVTETIRPRFSGTWNGIYRSIPVQYHTPQSLNYTLLLDIESVTDDEGRALRYESSRERHYRKLKIWVPEATDTTRTVVLRYRVRNGLKFFDEHDELYWNVTGDEWEVPIEAAAAQVHLPAGVSGVRAVAFTGGYGSNEQAATIETSPTEVQVRTVRRLNFREGLTVAVAWNAGLIPRPGPAARTASFLRSNWAMFLPLLALGVMGRLWYTRGRDPRLRPIVPQYAPPDGMTPAELGTLVDNSPDMRDITATLVDLAVRGYVFIEEEKKGANYVFTLRKIPAEKELLPHERRLLRAIFGRDPKIGSKVKMSALKNRFYKHVPDIRNQIFARLITSGHYRGRPDKVKNAYLIGGAVIGGLVAWAASFLNVSMGMSVASGFAAGILTAAVICGFALLMPVRTAQGARALEHARGFEEFLDRVESDRFDRMVKTPELFEKYLPYAMALGVDENWANAFDDINSQPPEWYRGGELSGFRLNAFTQSLGRMSTQAATVMAASPRGSGGSGFSGGGRSGGGFGGGGGGGF